MPCHFVDPSVSQRRIFEFSAFVLKHQPDICESNFFLNNLNADGIRWSSQQFDAGGGNERFSASQKTLIAPWKDTDEQWSTGIKY